MMDLSTYETPNAVLPPGIYTGVITGVETKTTTAGNGEYLKVEFTIASHGFTGRKIWSNFNTKNPNPKAVEIGMGQLKEMALAIGFSPESLKTFEFTQLANKEVAFKTKIKVDPTWGDKAEVSSYIAISKLTPEQTLKTQDIPF